MLNVKTSTSSITQLTNIQSTNWWGRRLFVYYYHRFQFWKPKIPMRAYSSKSLKSLLKTKRGSNINQMNTWYSCKSCTSVVLRLQDLLVTWFLKIIIRALHDWNNLDLGDTSKYQTTIWLVLVHGNHWIKSNFIFWPHFMWHPCFII